MFRFGVNHEFTANNPLAKWRKTKERKREVRLTVADLGKILTHAPDHLAWLIEVEWELGARPDSTELFSLTWSDVDFSAGALHIRGTKTESSDRVVPVTDSFLARLREKRDVAQTEFIIEYRGQPINNNVRKSLLSICARSEIPYPVRLYDLRHLFASTIAGRGRGLGRSFPTARTCEYYHHTASILSFDERGDG